MSKRGSNSELFAHENDALTARPLKSFEVHSLEFPASQIQKEDFIDVDPSVLVELFTSLLPNPSFLRVIGKLFAQ